MKSLKKIAAILAISLITISLSAQSPPPPNNGGGGSSSAPSGSGNTVGGGAPIGGGLLLLLGLGAAYGGRKLYELRKEKLEE